MPHITASSRECMLSPYNPGSTNYTQTDARAYSTPGHTPPRTPAPGVRKH